MSAFSSGGNSGVAAFGSISEPVSTKRKKTAKKQPKSVRAASSKSMIVKTIPKVKAADAGLVILNAKQFDKFYECMTTPAKPSKRMFSVSAEILAFSKLLR